MAAGIAARGLGLIISSKRYFTATKTDCVWYQRWLVDGLGGRCDQNPVHHALVDSRQFAPIYHAVYMRAPSFGDQG